MMVRTRAAFTVLVLAGTCLSFAARADATFPGSNGVIAFVANTSITGGDPSSSDDEIFTLNPNVSTQPGGAGLKQLTVNDFHDSAPNWSPDGQRLAFISDRDGNFEIYVMD